MLKREAFLERQWNDNKNYPLTFSDTKRGSDKKVWWVCEKGHEWEASLYQRSRGTNCPICSGNQILSGFNDLFTLSPWLASEWHPTRNGILDPTNMSNGSHKKIWWVCEKGHEWETTIIARTTKKSKCHICTNRKIVKGINDLGTTHPKIAEEFNTIRNDSALLNILHIGSGKKVWWVCEKGHEWEAVVESRKNHGCPKCGILKRTNTRLEKDALKSSLYDVFPKVANEFSAKNFPLTARTINSGSKRKVWWVCEKGHEWEASVFSRVKQKNGCVYCSGKKTLRGFNDIKTTNPELAHQWHPTKNYPLSSEEVTAGGKRKVWWVCEKGHEWEAALYSRKYGNGCPVCALTAFTSKPEKELADFIAEYYFVSLRERNFSGITELDVFIPGKNIAIEFNGLYWHNEHHKPKNYHYDKWLACKEQNIQLIQIWEDDWKRNPELIKAMLLHKLGGSNQEKISANKTKVELITKKEAETFLNENHIQGYASGSYYLGLKSKIDDTLVAVLVVKKERGNDNGRTLNIIRYATKIRVVGGFTKLLAYVTKKYNPEEIITFSDNSVSDGGLYKNNGFTVDKELPPDYMYVVKGRRKHKFSYRLQRFKNDPELLWEEDLSEKQLALLNDLPRIWDAGKVKWVKRIK